MTLWSHAEVVTLDSNRPRATALVSDGEKLVFVGDEAGAKAAAGPDAEHVDLGGKTVVPGFNDNHLHLVIYGDHMEAPDLTGLNEQQAVDRVAAFAPSVPRHVPVVAYAWDYPSCPHPRKELLDEVFPDRPVLLAQFGGHALWVNSFVLKAVGIDRYHSPPTGQVLRDDQGEPTGVLQEMSQLPQLGAHFHNLFFRRALRVPRIRQALDRFRRVGITSVQDNSWYHPVVWTLDRLRRRRELTARVSCWSFGRVPSSLPAMEMSPYHRDWIRKGPRKYYLDGTFTTRTAWMDEAYPGFPNQYGMGFDPRWLEGILERLVRQRKQGAFHSIGDRSTATFLDVWEKVLDRHPEGLSLRMRLEHVQCLRPGDAQRMKRLGVCAAVQPPALATPEKDVSLLGGDRALNCYPHRSLLDAGVSLSFGSDIPGESFCDPLRGMHLVCNRPGPQRISPEEALRAYTQGSAHVEFQEHQKGTLKPGFLADFTVLSENPLSVAPHRLQDLVVERTVVGGRTVWDASLSRSGSLPA
jgi:predicted amidohydrolase YtcJ